MTNTEYFKSGQTNSETSSTSGELTIFSKTLLIFDFDDTLFCTKYLDTFALPYQDIFTCKVSLEQMNSCLAHEIKELESAILDLFINLGQNCDIVIISNADLKWINNCMTHFLPELNDYLTENGIKIHSAKNSFSKFVKAPTDWKLQCFKKVIEELYEDDLFYDLNVISIGDGKEEKKAVFNLAKDLKLRKLRTKFIRMISFPSAASIVLQLKYLNNNINEMILDENSIYKMSIKFNNKKVEIDCKAKKGKNFKENGEKNYLNQVEENEFKQVIKQKINNLEDNLLFNDIHNNKEICGNKLLGQKSFLIK